MVQPLAYCCTGTHRQTSLARLLCSKGQLKERETALARPASESARNGGDVLVFTFEPFRAGDPYPELGKHSVQRDGRYRLETRN
jgi:hypothetical protein